MYDCSYNMHCELPSALCSFSASRICFHTLPGTFRSAKSHYSSSSVVQLGFQGVFRINSTYIMDLCYSPCCNKLQPALAARFGFVSSTLSRCFLLLLLRDSTAYPSAMRLITLIDDYASFELHLWVLQSRICAMSVALLHLLLQFFGDALRLMLSLTIPRLT